MTHPQFNLVRDPWVRCLLIDGTVVELSLQEVFQRSDGVRRLAGEVPTQDYAVLRVLLAIVCRSTPDITAGNAAEVWQEEWEDRSLLQERALDYLEETEDCFELFDPERPFMQVAGLQTASGKVDGVGRIIADVPSGHQYFTTRAGRGLDFLSYAEAARWLIHTHAFDPSGIKSGAVGDPRVRGGKGYPIGTGWAGATGGVYFEGTTLNETLLLNLDLAAMLRSDVDDRPVWERELLGPAEEERPVGEPRPTGPVDVFTWPSRRIRLIPGDGAVRNVLVSNGDALAPQNMDRDPMTAMRFSQPQTAKLKTPVFMPREHDPERTIWTGVASLLAREQQTRSDSEGTVLYKAPDVVTWIARLGEYGSLDRGMMLNLRLVGTVYGTQSSVISGMVDDSLEVHVGLLSRLSAGVAEVVKRAARETEQSVWALGIFAGDLSRAAGGDPEPPRETVRQRAYFELNDPYRQWIRSLTGEETPERAAEKWYSVARRIIGAQASDMVQSAGRAALTGRYVDGRLLSAATAQSRLNSALRRHLPLETDTDSSRRPAGTSTSSAVTIEGAAK
ncbi:type I-E CRISPR-associated protein Cse1/CasA [Arthrobacter woluwensis]|uniref:type I-E CRISPR-associated protein Cse1/CasA n=1 Tax=Arthrobacter woluwensis TaxID=156980 RepID=UPI000D13E011|nr:type I-E CRISPR-associated protein Cse1/CasA [Arthrobacter woluwensis]PSS43031.1 type I-E CRISPR-associated protein Cse1/CasA [Arthrobacter woluwensis]